MIDLMRRVVYVESKPFGCPACGQLTGSHKVTPGWDVQYQCREWRCHTCGHTWPQPYDVLIPTYVETKGSREVLLGRAADKPCVSGGRDRERLPPLVPVGRPRTVPPRRAGTAERPATSE
jgi:hypothetical protein